MRGSQLWFLLASVVVLHAALVASGDVYGRLGAAPPGEEAEAAAGPGAVPRDEQDPPQGTLEDALGRDEELFQVAYK